MTQPHTSRSARINFAGAVVLLALAVFTGGSSQESGVGVVILQLAALPCIAWLAWQHLGGQARPWPWQWAALVAAILAVPLLQLLPVPSALASMGEARALLQADLAVAGAPAATRATLDPAATRASLHALLPALAVFGLVLALPIHMHRRLAWFIAALAMASLLLGILQLGAPQESVLNPYPQWRPAMNGFFANPNHQATLLVVAGVLAAGWLFHAPADTRRHGEDRGRGVISRVAAAAVVVLAIAALPLTGSRAGVIIFILALAAVVASQGWRLRAPRKRRLLVAGSAAIAALGVLAATRWMRVDAAQELRQPLRQATLEVAGAHAPLGSGAGTFVPVFEQATSGELLMPNYVNHAHNEYAQWLLEAGVLAIPAFALALIALIAAARAMLRLPPPARTAGTCALLALLAIAAHSLVDYPLRTQAMLTVAAALAAIIATAHRAPTGTPTGRGYAPDTPATPTATRITKTRDNSHSTSAAAHPPGAPATGTK
ncbi:O-antigen ligase family protein [Luteimonas dalianensis]|uniref:O-antigen ligase family protein n=1 Tax=Luteimonas dalianensis TaxID=1148196 RepID=UPI003BF06802